jgi:acetolactate synthase-1/2/3 large subunit
MATPLKNPDFIKLAGAFGIEARRVSQREEVAPAIAAARAHDGPYLIEFVVERDEIVYPMVPAGASLDAMIRRPAADRIR